LRINPGSDKSTSLGVIGGGYRSARTRETAVMKMRTPVLAVARSLMASSACCFAQKLENFPDFALSGEQWRQRVRPAPV
jgi:hypothetical protein